ncbi:putative inactive cadmium/zinc-transporting ATPase HMA3 [Humulus lupulus]|uniref:putative inactive cadmium/zinc-transporting ATPase HMA3 n=1 Tax=Humulus lupulus TaxID=3486 RepID=UPI002B406058|nr:putative inactive cadmium/zinc-transporting ATPase HMA3 [Humulus lupulus]
MSDEDDSSMMIKKSYFEVLGLCCASEISLIEKIVEPLNGVKHISVIVPTKTLIVFHDSLLLSDSQIVEALNKARLEATVKPKGNEKYLKKKWPAPSVMACGLLLAMSFLKSVYQPLEWLALGSVLIGAPSIIIRSFTSIWNLTLNINILVLLAVVGTLALQDYWEAGTIVFLFSIAQWLESKASHEAMAAMEVLTSMAPQKATIAKAGEQVDVNAVKLNTILAVKAGEAIPIDGIVVEGKCEVDEKLMTGESFPVTKELDSTVWAGTINLNGYVSVKTTALAKDSVVARMTKLVEEALKKKSRAERFIDECAKYYIPIVMIISAGFAVVPAALRVPDLEYWFHLALVVLVSTCPCALVISTPVTIFCALSKAATTGLLIKGGDYLELLAKINTVAFDKTGTLTRGEFMVIDFQSISDEISLNTLLCWVSSIESKSSHPMAAALVGYGSLHSIESKPENVDNFQTFPGEGVFGKIDGKDIYIGNWRIGLRAGCQRTSLDAIQQTSGKTNGYIFCGATLVGRFGLSDTCRSGAAEAIEELKELGIRPVMLTGDSNAAAMLAWDQLDRSLDIIHAELLPEEKAKFIQEFKKDGPTAMIGDGINDALALAMADIGISMGISGSTLAMETGDIVLMSNDIRKIPIAIRLAKRTFRKLIENVLISITTKSIILVLAFAGYPLVWAAVLTDVGTCLVVILNSMLLLKDTPNRDGGLTRSEYGTFSSLSCKNNERESRLKNNRGYGLLETKDCNSECCNKTTLEVKTLDPICRQGESSKQVCRAKKCTDKSSDKVINVGSSNKSYSEQNTCQKNDSQCCSKSDIQICCKEKDTVRMINRSSQCCQKTDGAPDELNYCEAIDIAWGTNFVEAKVTDAYKRSKKMETDDCCKQMENQCFSKRDQFGTGVAASISEINPKSTKIGGCCKQSRERCCVKYEHGTSSGGGNLLDIVIE